MSIDDVAISNRKPTRWWLRLTIRRLMLAILVLAVGIGIPLRKVKRQEAAIAQISGLGGVVGFDDNYWVERGNYPPWPSGDPPLPQWLVFGGLIGGSSLPAGRGLPNEGPRVPRWLLNPLGPEFFRRANFVSLAEFNQKGKPIPGLAFLEDLPDVRAIQLDSRSFAESEMSHARSLKLIRFLASASSLGDEGLAYLADQDELWMIDLSGTQVTDIGLATLGRMPKLRFVDLSRLNIKGAGLAHLSQLTKMEQLTLENTAIGDDGLARLKGLSQLQNLDARGTHITNVGLIHLKDFPSLKGISLSRTGVTDAGLAHLKNLPGLEYVELPKVGVTDAGVADLQSALPKLRVERR